MLDLTRRLVWFFVVSCAVSYAVFLVAGNAIYQQSLGDTRVVLVRDSLKVGEHHLSGMVMVPRSCKQLSMRTEQIDPGVFLLKFQTWDEPNIECITEDTPRPFRAVVFAPSVGTQFIASLDDAPLRIAVTPAVSYTR